jgi:hypothetical protein
MSAIVTADAQARAARIAALKAERELIDQELDELQTPTPEERADDCGPGRVFRKG